MSETTILSGDGGPNTHTVDNASRKVHRKCWETTYMLEEKASLARDATHKNWDATKDGYRAEPSEDVLMKHQELRRKDLGGSSNCHLHEYLHRFSGRFGPDDPCDWEETHDSKGNRIAATTCVSVKASEQNRPEGPSTGHTCHGDWLNSGRLTVDETSDLKEAKSSYSEAESTVHKAEEAFFAEEPGAQDALNSAHESLFAAFENKDELLGSLQRKYPRCFTCKNNAVRASELEERFSPSPRPSQESMTKINERSL